MQISRCLCILFATAVILIASSAIFGWVTHTDFLIRYKANTAAMVINTAVLFIIVNLTLLLLYRINTKLIIIILCFIMTISIITFMQNLFNLDLNIYDFLFKHYDYTGLKVPGQMTISTAAGFIVVAATLLLVHCRKNGTCIMLAAGSSATIICWGALFISGYFLDEKYSNTWGSLTPMALNTAICFLMQGIALLSLVWNVSLKYNIKLMRFIPITLGVSIFITFAILAIAINHIQKQNAITNWLPLITIIVGATFAVVVGLSARATYFTYMLSKSLQESLALINATFEATADGIVAISMDNKIVNFNQKFIKMWNIQNSDMPLMNEDILIKKMIAQVKNKTEFNQALQSWQEKSTATTNNELTLYNGNIYQLTIHAQILSYEIVGKVCSFNDITLQRQIENKLLYQSTHDLLTDLPNKTLLLELINKAIMYSKHSERHLALYLIDLDHFANINDLLGRQKGDQILKIIANKLSAILKLGEILGRLGGDEFVLVQPDLKDRAATVYTINQILNIFAKPFYIYSNLVPVTCCIGVAMYPQDANNVEALLSDADVAMLRAKRDGRNSFQYFTVEMNKYTIKQLSLVNSLYRGLNENQFFLHYQPIINLKTNKCEKFEALIRWQHPTQGIISPNDFIPIAEEVGLIDKIGKWVIYSALKDLKDLHNAGHAKLGVSINVSAHQFKHGFLKEVMDEILHRINIDTNLITLELTERDLLDGGPEINQMLIELINAGFKIALDDFGTGYSSLTYLKKYSLHALKIDASFVAAAINNKVDRDLISAIITITQSLDLTSIAEGVETKQELELLQQLGCDYAQGYYFAKPMSITDCYDFLKKQNN